MSKKKISKKKIRNILVLVLIVLVIAGAAAYTLFIQPMLNQDVIVYTEGTAQYGALQNTVTESGSVTFGITSQLYELDLTTDEDDDDDDDEDDYIKPIKPSDPPEDPKEDDVIIEDPETPKSDTPIEEEKGEISTEIPEEETPKSDTPATEIEEEETPKADVPSREIPKTGDAYSWIEPVLFATALVTVLGMAIIYKKPF